MCRLWASATTPSTLFPSLCLFFPSPYFHRMFQCLICYLPPRLYYFSLSTYPFTSFLFCPFLSLFLVWQWRQIRLLPPSPLPFSWLLGAIEGEAAFRFPGPWCGTPPCIICSLSSTLSLSFCTVQLVPWVLYGVQRFIHLCHPQVFHIHSLTHANTQKTDVNMLFHCHFWIYVKLLCPLFFLVPPTVRLKITNLTHLQSYGAIWTFDWSKSFNSKNIGCGSTYEHTFIALLMLFLYVFFIYFFMVQLHLFPNCQVSLSTSLMFV